MQGLKGLLGNMKKEAKSNKSWVRRGDLLQEQQEARQAEEQQEYQRKVQRKEKLLAEQEKEAEERRQAELRAKQRVEQEKIKLAAEKQKENREKNQNTENKETQKQKADEGKEEEKSDQKQESNQHDEAKQNDQSEFQDGNTEAQAIFAKSLEQLQQDNCSKMLYFMRENLRHKNFKEYEYNMRSHSYYKRCAIVYKWMELVLRQWKEFVQMKGQDWTRDTEEGRQEIESLAKAVKYLKPLQIQLRKKQVSEEVLNPIYVVVRYEQLKDMQMAEEKYYALSIGDQPWPIGVTMVGIHERKGRAKIFSSQVLHVMNDPIIAEYIRSIKRLLTFCFKHHV